MAALVVEKPTGVEEVWKNVKEGMIEEAIEVCGETRWMRRFGEGEATLIQFVEGA